MSDNPLANFEDVIFIKSKENFRYLTLYFKCFFHFPFLEEIIDLTEFLASKMASYGDTPVRAMQQRANKHSVCSN